jgi:hypothetical protein
MLLSNQENFDYCDCLFNNISIQGSVMINKYLFKEDSEFKKKILPMEEEPSKPRGGSY